MLSDIAHDNDHGRDAAMAKSGSQTPLALAGLIALLPVLNGLLLRTYAFPLQPAILNPIFEFEFLYVAAEMGILIWAGMQGMSYKAEFLRLARGTRYALIAFVATFWISSLIYAPIPIYSMIRASYWMLHILCAFSVAFLLRKADGSIVEKSMVVFAGSFLLLWAIVFVHYRGMPVPLDVPTIDFPWSAYAPGFLSIRQFGMVSGFALACWLGFALSSGDKAIPGWATVFVSSLIFAALFWSGTRSALLGVAIAMPVTLLFARLLPSSLAASRLVAAAVIGVALSFVWLPPDPAFGLFQLRRFAVVGVDVSNGRGPLWDFGIAMFGKSPLLGWGEGSFYQLYAIARNDYHLQPHNFVIQFLMSWGAFAGGIALVMMARALWHLHTNLRHAPAAIAALAGLDSIIIMASFDGALFTLRTIVPAIFFWILAEQVVANGKSRDATTA